MDDPVPVRRAVIGCLTVAVIVAAIMLVVRPAIFSLAPPRDDTAVTVAAVADLAEAPIARDVLLSRSYGWSGEMDAGDGRVQVRVMVARTVRGTIVAVNAASPGRVDCGVEVAADRLRDCDGRTWTFEGLPIDAGTPLERFPVEERGGAIVVDFTRSADA